MQNFRNFYIQHKDRLFAYLMRMTGQYELSVDLLQESFTRYLERYRDSARSLSLLYTIARNAFYDHLRKPKPSADNVEQAVDTAAGPEKRLMVRQEYRRMLTALQSLKKQERDILSLAVSGDLNYREIAAIVGISEANVKVRVHRARQKLRKLLEQGEV
jgi:RNA polymerase sigma-70 factor (ECF subfamily)